MPPQVLYQIPYATGSVRLLMGMVGVIFSLGIFGWWLPRAIRVLRNLPAMSGGQRVLLVSIGVVPVAIGIGPLLLLCALLRNPMTYVTETGVMQERVFEPGSMTLTWGEIARVYCTRGRDQSMRRISLVAADGRRLAFGNTGGVDFESMHQLFARRLGPEIVRRCTTSLRS